jgi:hypothetical protein
MSGFEVLVLIIMTVIVFQLILLNKAADYVADKMRSIFAVKPMEMDDADWWKNGGQEECD